MKKRTRQVKQRKRMLAEEVARDLRALGSIPFYFIVGVRAVIGQYLLFVWQLVVAAVGLITLDLLAKRLGVGADSRIAGAFVLCTFTSLFYQELYFTVFAFVLLGMIIVASLYIRLGKSRVLGGMISGIICSALAYFIAPLF